MVRSLRVARAWCLASMLAACSSDPSARVTPPSYPIPFATKDGMLAVFDGTDYRSVFLKGVNLGVAVPGTQAGELAATEEQYARWFARMGELGMNVIRVYTLHYPRFYDAVHAYNSAHPEAPLYVLHGIWLDEDNPSGDIFEMQAAYEANVREVVDCVNGNRTIGERFGRAFGTYRTDISPWVIGWIAGREIAPAEVSATNSKHPDKVAYMGANYSLPVGTPLEVFWAQNIDRLVSYERDTYGEQRPVSVSSWPTLDPLRHPSENSESFEDTETLDLANLTPVGKQAGYFASFHAYPYYPDFMNEDPAYQGERDAYGPNPYIGYLRAIKRHYAPMPVMVAEFGVPTSFGNAHYSVSGMNHGGHDEVAQGAMAARMLENIHGEGHAGGVFFAWIDEWWKRTWIVDELSYPRDRYRLWHNVASPEQNFGLIAFDLGPPSFEDVPPVTSGGRVTRVEAAADAEFFHVELTLSTPLGETERMVLGYDTYADDLGEAILPDGTSGNLRRFEFALDITGVSSTATLFVTEAYDLFGIWHRTTSDAQKFHSTLTTGAPWHPVRWKNNMAHANDDGTMVFPETVDPVGTLRVHVPGGPTSSLDAVYIDGPTIRVRLPWTLLQFSDPSQLHVIHDDRATAGRESMTSTGIGIGISIGGALVETQRFAWSRWDRAPATTEREKASMATFGAACRAIR